VHDVLATWRLHLSASLWLLFGDNMRGTRRSRPGGDILPARGFRSEVRITYECHSHFRALRVFLKIENEFSFVKRIFNLGNLFFLIITFGLNNCIDNKKNEKGEEEKR
jgi:hypothetical protein